MVSNKVLIYLNLKTTSYSSSRAMGIATKVGRDIIVNFENAGSHESMKEKCTNQKKKISNQVRICLKIDDLKTAEEVI